MHDFKAILKETWISQTKDLLFSIEHMPSHK